MMKVNLKRGTVFVHARASKSLLTYFIGFTLVFCRMILVLLADVPFLEHVEDKLLKN